MLAKMRRWGITNPWVWVFLITTSLQIFRGSPIDTMIFGASTIITWLDAAGLVKKSLKERPKLANNLIAIVMVILGITLAFLPRHTYLHGVVMISILPVALYLVWYRDRGSKEKADPKMSRTKVIWVALCVALCLWEFAANIMGQLENNLYSHPTISILMDPFMDSTFGQSIFVALWLLIGLGFLRIWGRK